MDAQQLLFVAAMVAFVAAMAFGVAAGLTFVRLDIPAVRRDLAGLMRQGGAVSVVPTASARATQGVTGASIADTVATAAAPRPLREAASAHVDYDALFADAEVRPTSVVSVDWGEDEVTALAQQRANITDVPFAVTRRIVLVHSREVIADV